jgi:acyl transferase domain-containing protein
VVLKRLDDALRDGDTVRGVILGTGVNSAGRTIGLSLPNRDAQARLIRRVLAEAAVDPARLSYFEAHGTGTQAGDPAEAWAIGTAAAGGRAAPLPVGSVKTNIGHLEAGSGMAGLLKAMLVLDRGVVPPTLHQAAPNPNIDFAALNIRIPAANEALAGGAAAVVGVNSFGFGGTNACALLAPRAAPAAAKPDPRGRPSAAAAALRPAPPRR